nr:transmembrane protein 120A-like [Misgurnus anguillicaudatus]XP_055052146.1 transmembrane protein 120A-like [Misgurnus anguillicaudatus]XP_055052147.1 transmembrane protein 120A-like [Misgurnus anguillicaudatus]XP_055052148.1 transmembrane protein 120A-like [Misgurnus anguillicaudatus]
MSTALATAFQEWDIWEKELQQIQETHRLYIQKLDEVSKLQKNFAASIARQRKNIKDLSKTLKKVNKGLTEEEKNAVEKVKSHIQDMPTILNQMEAFLPKENGLYLSLVLGNVNVNLLSKESKAEYKDEYEKFKLCVTLIMFLLTFLCRFFINYRVVDALLNFVLVWYYCTLTIRESILISNGSRIKGWWVFHHYISTFLSGVMLTWPDGEMYQSYRNQFLAYSLYQSFVQLLQYYYQSGCLYRLKALGERHNLDLTVEGFQSWMWRGLTFLLPFLFLGQFWQFWNSITLFRMAQLPECKEWQVSMCGFCFLVLFTGNFLTTLAVVRHKLKNDEKIKRL